MARDNGSRIVDFSEMDSAGISREHWKILFISGMGFFTDAYDTCGAFCTGGATRSKSQTAAGGSIVWLS